MNCPKCNSNNTKIVNPPGRKLFACNDCNHVEILEENRKAMEAAYGVKSNSSASVKCTYCGSTNVKRITMLSNMFTLNPLKKAGKQWHCNNCRSDF